MVLSDFCKDLYSYRPSESVKTGRSLYIYISTEMRIMFYVRSRELQSCAFSIGREYLFNRLQNCLRELKNSDIVV